MNMPYQQHNTTWFEEIERAVETHRHNTLKNLMEAAGEEKVTPESDLIETPLYKVEEKIRDAKHFIRRCRSEHVWMPALIQGPEERLENMTLNPHSLDAHHRYEKALQECKRRLDRYERIKNVLQEKAYTEKEQ
jgi:hypothetical protein